MREKFIKELKKYINIERIYTDEIIGYTDGTNNVRIRIDIVDEEYTISIYNYKTQQSKRIKDLNETEVFEALDTLLN